VKAEGVMEKTLTSLTPTIEEEAEGTKAEETQRASRNKG